MSTSGDTYGHRYENKYMKLGNNNHINQNSDNKLRGVLSDLQILLHLEYFRGCMVFLTFPHPTHMVRAGLLVIMADCPCM